MASKMGLIGCSLVIMVALMLKGATADLYVAGDSFGWNVPQNTSFYSDWASSKNFEIGDQVLFNWTGTSHNLAEVSTLAEYENCTKPGIVFHSGFIANLNSNGSSFFICTVNNHCELGMKMIVTVGSPTNTSTAWTPSRESSNALSSLVTFGAMLATFSAIVVSLFNYV